MPVIPVTWETEAGESLEPGRQRLRWAKIVPLHSSLGNKSKTPSQKKKERKRKDSGAVEVLAVSRREGGAARRGSTMKGIFSVIQYLFQVLVVQQDLFIKYLLSTHLRPCTRLRANVWECNSKQDRHGLSVVVSATPCSLDAPKFTWSCGVRATASASIWLLISLRAF